MKATIYKSYTEIELTREEVQACKGTGGADRCIWLIDSGECLYHNRPPVLVAKLRDGDTVGKRDGCDRVKSFDPSGKPLGKVDI